MIGSSVYRFRPWTKLQVVLDQFKGATSPPRKSSCPYPLGLGRLAELSGM